MNESRIIESTLKYLKENNYLINSEIIGNEAIVKEIEDYNYNQPLFTKNTGKKPEEKKFEIQNRRYLGNKYKLIPFIQDVIDKEIDNFESFFDIFSGTGVVASAFNTRNKKVIVNDLLKSNYFAYETWFGKENYDKKKIAKIINKFNNSYINESNYVSKHFGDRFFSIENSMKIGYIREEIETLFNKNDINSREKAILVTSLLYALDKVANTCGHYDAYRKKLDKSLKLKLLVPEIDNKANWNNEIYNTDSNILAKDIKSDIVYIDPPYNSRQYGDAYHLLENIAEWKKPKVTGVAKKMVNRSHIKSKYCTVAAPVVFRNLIESLNCKYILVSYNNMGGKGVGRSQAKISDKEIISILESKGEVKVFEQDYKYFTTGKSEIDDHKERIFLCKVKDKKKCIIKDIKLNSKKKEIVKSPLNYTGGKYKLLPQIKKHFPKNIKTFYDIFTGGANVGVNVEAEKTICIDKEKVVIDLYKLLSRIDYTTFVEKIDEIITKYNLSNSYNKGYEFYNCDSSKGLGRYNKKHYIELRERFNSIANKEDSEYLLIFYTLIMFSFNNQIRFNKNGKLNIPVGKRDFNRSSRKKLKLFMDRIKKTDIDFINSDFRNIDINKISKNDFVYLDPPYFIANASYNENGLWTKNDEIDLLNFLERLNAKGIKFALSNVLIHKNEKHKLLDEWIKENSFEIHYLDFNYNNSNYQARNKKLKTVEVLVTNY